MTRIPQSRPVRPLDATALALIATVPCVARSGASAYALQNDPIAIVGGRPDNDPIERFTPGVQP